MIRRLLTYILVLAMLSHAGLAVAMGVNSADGKVLICTNDGVRYVDASELPNLPDSDKQGAVKCPLCIVHAVEAYQAPSLEVTSLDPYVAVLPNELITHAPYKSRADFQLPPSHAPPAFIR